MRKAPSIKLTQEERDELSKTARRHTGAMRDTLRARIILLAADGLKNQEIAKTLGTSGNSVGNRGAHFPGGRIHRDVVILVFRRIHWRAGRLLPVAGWTFDTIHRFVSRLTPAALVVGHHHALSRDAA